MKRVIFAILTAMVVAVSTIPAAARRPEQPDGLAPTTAAITDILKTYHSALGKRDATAPKVTIEDWTYDDSGVAGTEHLVQQGTDYHAHLAYGPLTEDFGQFLGKAWHRDYNGVSTPSSGGDVLSFSMLIFAHVMDEVDNPKYDLTVLGEVASPKPAYVVSVTTNHWTHPDWFFFDKSTGLVDEVVRIFDDYRMVLTYDDYQKILGVERPAHIHSSLSDKTEEVDYRRTSFSTATSADAQTFLAPPSQHTFAEFNGMSWLPTHMVNRLSWLPMGNGFIIGLVPQMIVPVMVNGRRLDFAISSGLSRSIIDTGVAYELGLPTFGHTTRGDVPYETVLPQATIGSLTLKNLAIRAEPFHYHPKEDTKIVGVIGADILSAGLVKLDLTNGSMLLMPPNAFGGGSPDKKALQLSVDIDDGEPFARGIIAGQQSSNILIDNDEDFSAMYGSFTANLPGWSQRQGHAMGATVPFADNKSFGLDADFWPGAFDLTLGPISFQSISMLGTEMPAGGLGRDVDAIIGSDILRYYDMYLDYQHDQIFLKPNDAYDKRFGTAKEGSR